MEGTILWALANGILTGGALAGIVLLRRQRRLAEVQPRLLEEMEHRLNELGAVEKRLAEVEGRLEFAERLLAAKPDVDRQRLPHPDEHR